MRLRWRGPAITAGLALAVIVSGGALVAWLLLVAWLGLTVGALLWAAVL